MAYDPVARRLVLFGGESSNGNATNATYQYLVDSNSWQQDSPSGTIPPDRSFAQCAWNPDVGRVMLYGGQGDSGSPAEGTYLYDPASQVWTSVPPPTSPTSSNYPGSYSDGSAAYSPHLGGILWFGGRLASTTYSDETWLMAAP